MNDSYAAAADELLVAVGLLRRTVRRALRQVSAAEPLPGTQAELLRLAESRPGITVAAAAEELHLAPNSVSTLVGRLTSAGLLSRSRSTADGRAALLTITSRARARLAERRDLRAELAGVAFGQMSPADRKALTEAVPAILRLAEGIRSAERAA